MAVVVVLILSFGAGTVLPLEGGDLVPKLGECETAFMFHKFTLQEDGEWIGGYSHDWEYYSCETGVHDRYQAD